jgi:hypothetical protein
MPETPFKKEMWRRDADLDAVLAMADVCLTSRTATAFRFAELSDVAVAVIISTAGVIDYCFMSEAMKSLPKLDWLRKGTPLPPGTMTAGLAGDPLMVRGGDRVADSLDVRGWLGGPTKAEISEESVGLGSYGKVLTVLVSQSIGQEPDPNEDEDEVEIVERWTPRFHR